MSKTKNTKSNQNLAGEIAQLLESANIDIFEWDCRNCLQLIRDISEESEKYTNQLEKLAKTIIERDKTLNNRMAQLIDIINAQYNQLYKYRNIKKEAMRGMTDSNQGLDESSSYDNVDDDIDNYSDDLSDIDDSDERDDTDDRDRDTQRKFKKVGEKLKKSQEKSKGKGQKNKKKDKNKEKKNKKSKNKKK